MNSKPITNALDTLKIPYEENTPLERFTTFRIGGSAPLILFCQNGRQLETAVSLFHQHQIGFQILGEGSNVLMPDAGLPCPVIRFFSETPDLRREGNSIISGASTRLDDLALFAAQNGLEGINFANGIPGTVGGAVVGNAGAFGSQISDAVVEVELLSAHGEKRRMKKSDLHFSYRDSSLKESTDIVLTVRFSLNAGSHASLLEKRQKTLMSRREKHPDYHQTPCAGSFFKNIVLPDGSRQAAGWFLEQAGCKQLRVNDAGVFQQHANIIINQGKATAMDVLRLAAEMRVRVRNSFGFELEPEVRIIDAAIDPCG